MKARGADPFVGVRLELPLQLRDLRPRLEIVVDVAAFLDRDHFRDLLAKQRERAARVDDPHRRVEAVQNQHLLVKYACYAYPNHGSLLLLKVQSSRMVADAGPARQSLAPTK